jgi:D-alanine-D-alanine ligase
MMAKKNILLLCGGGGSEHEVSIRSAHFFKEKLSPIKNLEVHFVEIGKDQVRRDDQGRACELRKDGLLIKNPGNNEETIRLHFAIPCIHGPPGETGHIPAVFELMGLPFFGTAQEASSICFNKMTTKLWFTALDIPNTPSMFIREFNSEKKLELEEFFEKMNNDIFIKAASQGSSIGCYHVTKEDLLEKKVKEAFQYSELILIEKTLKGRELEVAAYEYKGELHITAPGEIVCEHNDENSFYDYEEKYSKESHATTHVEAPNLNSEQINLIKKYSRLAFKGLGLRHLSRIDFFLTEEGKIYLNEVNTFPGHTSISMFPSMLENNGHNYTEYLKEIIDREARS